jgi:Na+/proline symporter
VLDAGLSVLSLGSGPVLGAFLLGTLSRTAAEREVFAGMIAGLAVMAGIWWATPIAWTWYALIGAATTIGVAAAARAVAPARERVVAP